MKKFLYPFLTILLTGSSVISQSSQEPPELQEATELTKSLVQLFKEQKFDKALPLAKRALEIRERLLPRTDQRVATSLANLGDVYMAKHEYDNARKTLSVCSRCRKRSLVQFMWGLRPQWIGWP